MTHRMPRYWRATWLAATRLGILLIAVWGALALWFQAPRPALWFLLAVWCVFAAAALATPWLPRGRRTVHLLSAAGLALLLTWWTTLQPSHDRIWADDVARLLESEVSGSHVVLHNVRNFDWRSEDDYSSRWETREYDLDTLATADLILSYWMGPHIAHTLVSFGFDDGRQLVFSLEIRKEQHEAFSATGGFFRKFETVVIAADENDIVRTRTNARGEDVHLYRLDASPDALRKLLLGYLDEAEAIRRTPRFYNTLASNCTTIIYTLARGIAPALPLDYRLLLSGHFAEYVHDAGGLVPGHDYAQLQAAGRISDRARAFTGPPEDFSRAIRTGVPGIKDPARP
ncbi:lipoprotein N-acyltransferase Lnb domain-containing protein [Luteimonas sp. A277]